jgi:DNA-binding NtrC family response regulator
MTKTEWPEDIRELYNAIHKAANLIVDTLIENDVPIDTGVAALAWIISAAIRTMPAEMAREKVSLIEQLLKRSLPTN